MIGAVAISVHPITAGVKLLFPFVTDRLSNLENYFAQYASSLQASLEDGKMLLPIWIVDDSKRLSSCRPQTLLPAPLDKEKLKSPPPRCVLPLKVMYEVKSQPQKPKFDAGVAFSLKKKIIVASCLI